MPDRMPIAKETKVAVFRRDGWMCCWCKRPVIFAPVMKYLTLEVEALGIKGRGLSQAAYYHVNWTRTGAPLLDELGAVVDHLNAHSSSLNDNPENLGTACNKCNARKSAAKLEDWNKRARARPVKGKYGEPQNWDGMTSVFIVLASKHSAILSASEKEWLRALG